MAVYTECSVLLSKVKWLADSQHSRLDGPGKPGQCPRGTGQKDSGQEHWTSWCQDLVKLACLDVSVKDAHPYGDSGVES